MSKGWKEVARVGGAGARYPRILADGHGWCLRLGSKPRQDEKYYSSLLLLLHGLLEHFARRRLIGVGSTLDLEQLISEVRDSFHSALGLCHEVLEKGGLEEHIRRLEPSRGRSPASVHAEPIPVDPSAGQDAPPQASRREAV